MELGEGLGECGLALLVRCDSRQCLLRGRGSVLLAEGDLVLLAVARAPTLGGGSKEWESLLGHSAGSSEGRRMQRYRSIGRGMPVQF